MKNHHLGPLAIFLAATLWSFGGLLGKLLPISGLSVAILRGGIAALVIALYRRRFLVVITKATVLAGISLALTTLLYMSANKLTTAANAVVLQYTSPIYIILLNYIFLKHKPSKLDLFALVGVFTGLLLFFMDALKAGNLTGDLLALASGLSFSGVFFANKLKGANPIESVYLGNLLSFLLLPLVFLDPQIFTLNLKDILLLLVMGIFQLGIAYILFSIGISRVSATSASIIATIEPILNPVWVFLFLGELPTRNALIGACVVLITVIVYNQIQSRNLSFSLDSK